MKTMMSYEQYLVDVKKGIVTDQGNCPVTPLLQKLQGKWKSRILYELCIHELTLEQIVEMVHLIPGDFVVYRLIGRTMKVLYFSDTILSSFGVSRAEFSAATEDDALDVVMIRLENGSRNWVRKNITLAKRPESGDIISFAAISDINEEKLTSEIMAEIVSKQFDYVGCINAETGRFVLFFSKSSRPELRGVRPGMPVNSSARRRWRTSSKPSTRRKRAEKAGRMP